MSRCVVGAVLLLVVGFAVPAHAQAPLEWKFKKGDHFYLRNVTSTEQTLRMHTPKGVKESNGNSSKQTIVLGFAVVDVTADKNVVLKETIEDVTIKPENGQSYSSPALVGAELTITISPKGDILKFDGYDKLIEQLAAGDATVQKALRATVQEEALKKTVREVLLFLPDTPAKEDMKWERTIDEPFGVLGTLHETRKFQLKGKAERGGKMVDQIGFTTAVTYTEGKKDAGHPYHVVSGKVDAKPGSSTGTILFDASVGRLVEINSKVKLEGEFVVSIADVPVRVEVEQAQTTVVEVLTDKPAKTPPSDSVER